MKVTMGNGIQHLSIEFDPAHGDYRQVIIDSRNDVRIGDGKTIVKVRFTKEGVVQDVLQDDVFLKSVNLGELYQTVERLLSHSLQPATVDKYKEVQKARNELREWMKRQGWQGQF